MVKRAGPGQRICLGAKLKFDHQEDIQWLSACAGSKPVPRIKTFLNLKLKDYSMVKKRVTKRSDKHPIFKQKLNFSKRASDFIAEFGGSWYFIAIFGLFLVFWMGINLILLLNRGFDPYPFILLNLVLSCLAAIQAPIILMSQNRQAERDRIDAKYDHLINRKAEREIQMLQKEIDILRAHMREVKKKV